MSRRTERLAQEAALQANEAAKGNAPEVAEEPAKQEPVSIKPRNEAYEQAHAEIEKRYLKTQGLNEDGTPIEEPKEEAKEDVKEEPKEGVKEPQAEEEPQPENVKIKVDGEEFDVPKAEIEEAIGLVPGQYTEREFKIALAAYQKNRAADNRLKRANETAGQLKKTQEELLQLAVRQAQAQQPQQPQLTDDQFIAQKLDQIRYGSPEEGASALREVLQRTQQKIDPNLMIAQATAQMRRQLAVDRFKDEFSDIATNQDLLQFAAVLEQQSLAQIQPQALYNLDWNDHYRKIGNKIRSLVGKPNQPTTSAPTQGNTSQPSAKEERKASITVLPTASARAEVKVEKVLTPEEARQQAIADMRAANSKLKGEATG